MEKEKMKTEPKKSHWSHSDMFGGGEYEYIKSFVHHNYSIGFHTHSFYELNIVLNGKGKHYIEQMSCEAKAGCVFIIPPNIHHAYTNNGEFNVYHMLIHRDFFNNCLKEFMKTMGFTLLFEIEPYLRAQYNENIFLILSEMELNMISADIESINACESMAEKDIFINAIAKKMISQLCMLITQRQGIEKLSPQSNKELQSVTDCLNFIHQNFDEHLTVELLAERLNMSKSTFVRQFTKICGCPPYEYIKQYRIKKAREYLDNTSETVTSVAQKCGFYDASHLRKCLNMAKNSRS